jgi:hypothetical protein
MSGGSDAFGYIVSFVIAAVVLLIIYLMVRSRPKK